MTEFRDFLYAHYDALYNYDHYYDNTTLCDDTQDGPV